MLQFATTIALAAMITGVLAIGSVTLRLRPTRSIERPADDPVLFLVRDSYLGGARFERVTERFLVRGVNVTVGADLPAWVQGFSDDWFNRVGILPICHLETGWPLPWLAAEAAPGPSTALTWTDALTLPHPLDDAATVVIPARVDPARLLADVAIWSLAIFGLVRVRGGWRRLRGRCPRCGHTLHGATGCTECGRGMPPADEADRIST